MILKNIVQAKKERIEDLPSFLFKTGNLLQEGYRLAESLVLLLPYYTANASYYQNVIEKTVGEGYGAPEIFKQFQLDREFLVAIYFAEKHGDMASTLQLISKQMKYKKEMKQRLKKIIAYPLFMFGLLVAFFISFRLFFLPNISHLILSRSDEGQSTILWSKFLLHVPDYFIGLAMILLVGIGLFVVCLYRKDIKSRIHLLLKIPGISTLYRLSLTKQFARSLGNLIMSGFSLQQSIQELKSQNFNVDIQYIATEMEHYIVSGYTLTSIVQLMPYFFPKLELFVEHGEKNGLLGRELVMYCDVLDEKLKHYAEMIFRVVQPLTFVIIAICIIAAYLSILLPMYKMIDII